MVTVGSVPFTINISFCSIRTASTVLKNNRENRTIPNCFSYDEEGFVPYPPKKIHVRDIDIMLSLALRPMLFVDLLLSK